MSKASVTEKYIETVVIKKEKVINLELTEIEGLVLQTVLYAISGDSKTSIRKYTDNISKNLDEIGLSPSLSLIGVVENFLRVTPDSAKILEDLQNGKS